MSDIPLFKQIRGTAVEGGKKILMVNAIYSSVSVPEHQGNILIEALPPFFDAEPPIEKLAHRPPYDVSEKNASTLYRFNALERIKVMLETMPWHIEVMYQVMRNLWAGYARRNPLKDLRAVAEERYRKLKEANQIDVIADPVPAHASMFGLLGGSGLGKSSVVHRVLSFLPQVIKHEKYAIYQLVWLKVDCTTNGSINDLILWIIQAADRALGSNYESLLRSRSTYPERVAVAVKIFRDHYVGLLVLDEIQNVMEIGTGRIKDNFFTGFPNIGDTPIMHIGLPIVLARMPQTLHPLRRLADDGITPLGVQMELGEWALYLDELVRYQWTQESASIEEIADVMGELTQRIPGLASRLWQIAQARAIESEAKFAYYQSRKLELDEPPIKKITGDLLRLLAEKYFKPVMSLLDRVRLGKTDDLGNYDAKLKEVGDAIEGAIRQAKLAAQRSRIKDAAREGGAKQIIIHATGILLSMGEKEDAVMRVLPSLAAKNPTGGVQWLIVEYLNLKSGSSNEPRNVDDLEKRVVEEMNQDFARHNGKKE
ncbi:AAA family ATPase [Cupriavidus necator]